MSSKTKEKLALIKKFMDPKSIDLESIKSIKSVGKLPVSSFKFLSKEDGENLKYLLKISKISDLLKIDRQKPFKKVGRAKAKKAKLSKIKKEDPEFKERLKQAVTISIILEKIIREDATQKRLDQKVIVVGLNNAGKTAILSKFGGRLGIKDLASLKPTRGVNRQEIKTKNLNLHLWDFGGQIDHREEYLQSPEKYFFGIDLIIYVIDIQDSERYEESIEYFNKIIDNVIKLKESPHILIFIHKLDPDIKENDEVVLNVELVKEMVKNALKDKEMNYDIYVSSIYSMISNEPQFSKFIKDVMSDSSTIEDPTKIKIEQIGAMVEKALNAIIQLSSTMMALEKRIEDIEQPKRSRATKKRSQEELPTPEYSKVVLPPPPPPSMAKKPKAPDLETGQGLRTTIMSELKDMFVKKGINRRYDLQD
jgi:small GTP-binding protein